MNKLRVHIIRMDKEQKYCPYARPANTGIASIRVHRMCARGKWQEEMNHAGSKQSKKSSQYILQLKHGLTCTSQLCLNMN